VEAPDRWTTPRLAEFVAAITGAADEESATRRAVDWATEALEAEIGVIIEGGVPLASVGFPRGGIPSAALNEAIIGGSGVFEVEGLGMCCLASTRLEFESAVDFVVVRAGTDAFNREEVGLLRAAARSLTLTLRLFRALSAERTMSWHLQQRQKLLERLAAIQRSITRRVPLADVLSTITRSARDLLDVEIAAVRLVDPDSPREMVMVASEGLPPDVVASMKRTGVGGGAGGRAVAEDRLVVIENYGSAPEALTQLADESIKRAMAAPVRDGDIATGSITVATKRAELTFGPLEQEALLAFAEHASLAITDAKRVEHIQKLAFYDELTGLPNRGLFLERLDQAIIRARRRRGHVAVLFLDLDRFKTINDSLGHAAGDQLLVTVGERLRGCLRDEDTASRLGGDEFAILAHCNRDGAVGVAERVLAALEPPFLLDFREVSMAASIGIALDQGGRSEAGTMLRDADTAMYRAKFGSGGGYVVFEPSMYTAALERIDFESALHGAAERGEMHLDYQPIFDLAQGRVSGFEALIRWNHPERGVMSPLDFIPLAEETGQIASLGRWTLDEACTQVRRWQQLDPSLAGLVASVNVSPLQLRDSRFDQDVARSLERSGLKATDLSLEITEGAVMVDVETATRRLHALRELGVSLAIDDFGTGHSSLALLRRLPVDSIKIDKMFVDTIVTDSTAASLLETIIQMAGILSLQVVVEGIETADQAALIATFGNVFGQGYQLGRPVGVAATNRLLADGVLTLRDQSADAVRARQRRPRLVMLPTPGATGSSTPRAG
jgi:diguanylate cyclase (GGDEF)-like protein